MQLLDRLGRIVARRYEGRDPAHDLSHVLRVARAGRTIAGAEGADRFVVETAALLHELVTYPKDHPLASRSGDESAREAESVLGQEGADEPFIERVSYAIKVHAFSTGIHPDTLEARVLQDADRLDAIGAIGIARCFATGARMGIALYDPADPWCACRQPDDKRYSLDHFKTKLLVISDRLHTRTARDLALARVETMRAFLASLETEISSGTDDASLARPTGGRPGQL